MRGNLPSDRLLSSLLSLTSFLKASVFAGGASNAVASAAFSNENPAFQPLAHQRSERQATCGVLFCNIMPKEEEVDDEEEYEGEEKEHDD